jgi:tetratricopeptide (TPR) repeat protein
VPLVNGETSGYDPEMRGALNRGRPPLDPQYPQRRALDPLMATDLAAAYVALTIDCEQPKLIEKVDMEALTTQYESVPLMKFRLGRCGRPTLAPRLAALRAADPRWTDTLFWEGRAELVGSQTQAIDFPKAIALMGDARQAFPRSWMMTMGWSQANLSVEEFEAALSGFDAVLKDSATHRDALIGRVTALSYLMRHDEAIASATQILELGTWHIGDANYWRAWNRYHLKEYEPAWIDVENAIKGLSNSRVYMLAGLIAYARKDLPTAILRFDRAYELDSSACDATWMSGLVSIDQEDLKLASPKFTRAMSCFIKSAAELRREAARIEAAVAKRGTPATPREQRLMERALRNAENADERSAQSAFNAAQCLARLGDKSQALTHADVAAQHPKMREKALALRAAIEKLP